MKKLKQWVPIIAAVIIAFGSISLYTTSSRRDTLFNQLELKTIDFRFLRRGETPPGDEVILAVVDEKSLAKEGKWVWPRSKFARLIDILSEEGASVIAFDIVFAEPDKNDDIVMNALDQVENHYLEQKNDENGFIDYLKQLKKRENNDELLAEAIQNSKADIVLGYYFEMEEQSFFEQHEMDAMIERIQSSRYRAPRCPPGMEPEQVIKKAVEAAAFPQSNIKAISNASEYAGFFNMAPDKDGSVRRMPSVFRCRDYIYPPLSLVALSRYINFSININFVKNEIGDPVVNNLVIGDKMIKTTPRGEFFINYRGPSKTFKHVSITDILHRNFSEGVFKDKIVIVGATAIGIYDVRVTPFEELFPGMEVHANIIDMILSENFLGEPDWHDWFIWGVIFFAALALGFLLPRIGAVQGAIMPACLLFGYAYLSQYLFNQGIVVNTVYPLFSILFTYFIVTIYVYFTESRKKMFIKNAFSTYLAPSVVDYLIESPDKLVLGGENRVITSFFSDVQNFTMISEKLAPEALVELLNEFLTEMTDIILENKGTVDKFEGDAIIAFFGAPVELENQAALACSAAVQMQNRLFELRKKWGAEGKPELRMRVGLYTGPAVVGNMGSRNRMDYTMMGDTVNTAARLEGVNKIYGTYMLIGERTRDEIDESVFFIREIDSILVVGKQKPIGIYELAGFQTDISDAFRRTAELYAEGVNAYKRRDWDKAVSLFNQGLEHTPHDPPSKTMIERCIEYKANPPAEGWSGVFYMKTK